MARQNRLTPEQNKSANTETLCHRLSDMAPSIIVSEAAARPENSGPPARREVMDVRGLVPAMHEIGAARTMAKIR
jgi:hypothetical protein